MREMMRIKHVLQHENARLREIKSLNVCDDAALLQVLLCFWCPWKPIADLQVASDRGWKVTEEIGLGFMANAVASSPISQAKHNDAKPPPDEPSRKGLMP